MEAGNVWEHQTGKALTSKLNNRHSHYLHWRRGDPALRVGNKYWSGHIDFWIEPCEMYPGGAIIEHKATNPKNFQIKGRLPYEFHCLQVLTYERLLRAQLNQQAVIPTYLYYRSWNHWAELEVWSDGTYLVWEGEINGRWKSGEIEMEYTLSEQMEMLEYAWRQRIHAVYREANRLRREASLKNRKYRDYLQGKYNLQPSSPVTFGVCKTAICQLSQQSVS
jgi:hypothetical protein